MTSTYGRQSVAIGLPDMDGYELGRILKRALPAIHLIALTGYGR